MNSNIHSRARKIKVILMDVDGVLTRGMIVYDSNGIEIKHFDAHDGLGIKLAKIAGLQTGIISARDSETIRKRSKELGIDYLYLGQAKKLEAFKRLQKELKLNNENFCFIGDDLPDIPVLKEVGLGVAVKSATEITKSAVNYITEKSGGEGAVREVIEIILKAQGKLNQAIQKVWE